MRLPDKDEIINKLFEMWFAYFGRPERLISDNGGEFCNEMFQEAAEKLGIEITMPPVESPFSNGIVETQHQPVRVWPQCQHSINTNG